MDEAPDMGMEADVLSATLHAGLKEAQDLLDFLAQKFEGPLSHLIEVRRRGGLFGNKHAVEEITFKFEDRQLRITRESHGSFSAKSLKVVRGVVLKTNVVDIEQWIGELSQALARQAEKSESFRTALSRFVLE